MQGYSGYKQTAMIENVPSKIQSNLNSSNTDGSLTMANSNAFLSPYEILPIAQNKYLGRRF